MSSRFKTLWTDWLKPVLIVILVATSFRSAIADWNDVPTGSMKPTILEGDRIVVNKLAYDLRLPYTCIRLLRWSKPERGDIVVLRSPADGVRLVKRVVGLPGDTIAMFGNRLVVNGEAVRYSPSGISSLDAPVTANSQLIFSEDFGSKVHDVMFTPGEAAPQTFEPILVPDGRYFVMGDNRDRSMDSRFFGYVDRDAILGQATAVAGSVNPEKRYLPRWERFFTALK